MQQAMTLTEVVVMSQSPPARCVLLVDDFVYTLNRYKRRLRELGWLVKTAETCAAAIAHLTPEMPDLLIVDLFLDGELGLDVVEAARGRSRTVPIAVVTAGATLRNAVVAMREGATTVVSKLKSVDHVLAEVAQAATMQAMRTGGPGLDSLEMVNNQQFLRALEESGGSKRLAAAALEVSLSTVKRRVEQFDWLVWDPDERDD